MHGPDPAATCGATPQRNLLGGFASIALVGLVAYSILPAWRLQIFGSDYDSYYAIRCVLLVGFVAFFYVLAPRHASDLSVGSSSPIKTGYGDPLLLLRATACFMVLIGHGSGGVFAPAQLSQLASNAPFWLYVPLPWAGVWIFFTLSGYLMGKAFFTGRYLFSRGDILRFYRSRLLRILPLAYFAIAIMALFVKPEALRIGNAKHLIALMMFDYDGTSPMALIGLLWSIATEMQFYALAPFAALALYVAAKRTNIFYVAAGLLILGASYRLGCLFIAGPHAWLRSVYTPLLGNLDLFGLGMITSYAVQAYPLQRLRVGCGIALLAAVYMVCGYAGGLLVTSSRLGVPFLQYCAPSIVCLCTVAIIVLFENGVAAGPRPSWLVRTVILRAQIFGTLTYAIYIWHAPIFESYSRIVVKPLMLAQSMISLSTASIFTVGFAWITYRLIERPFDDLKKLRPGNPVSSRSGQPISTAAAYNSASSVKNPTLPYDAT